MVGLVIGDLTTFSASQYWNYHHQFRYSNCKNNFFHVEFRLSFSLVSVSITLSELELRTWCKLLLDGNFGLRYTRMRFAASCNVWFTGLRCTHIKRVMRVMKMWWKFEWRSNRKKGEEDKLCWSFNVNPANLWVIWIKQNMNISFILEFWKACRNWYTEVRDVVHLVVVRAAFHNKAGLVHETT